MLLFECSSREQGVLQKDLIMYDRLSMYVNSNQMNGGKKFFLLIYLTDKRLVQ